VRPFDPPFSHSKIAGSDRVHSTWIHVPLSSQNGGISWGDVQREVKGAHVQLLKEHSALDHDSLVWCDFWHVTPVPPYPPPSPWGNNSNREEDVPSTQPQPAMPSS